MRKVRVRARPALSREAVAKALDNLALDYVEDLDWRHSVVDLLKRNASVGLG
jgi:hypothetical protein